MDDPAIRSWSIQLHKGLAELCILACLQEGEVYGYQILQTLAAIPGLEVGESTVYPILSRAARTGLVITESRPSESGPPRRYYRLTPKGRARLREMAEHWKGIVDSANALIFNKKSR